MAGSRAVAVRGARARVAGAAVGAVLALAAAPPIGADGGPRAARGSLLEVAVEVAGRRVPLYRARDGSGRHYLEARAGLEYALHVSNRSAERVAVLLSVDGLNVISGEREPGPAAHRPGRMYVLEPWGEVHVRGWRTSLEEVRRFTFVDEGRSYAARTGQANAKMGWIQAWAYRERPQARVWPPPPWAERSAPGAKDDEAGRPRSDPERAESPPAASPPAAGAEEKGAREGDVATRDRARSYPGTGWGDRAWDPATVVDFRPEPRPADAVTLRYEYAHALRALGLWREPSPPHRLREREAGAGFARPPDW